MKVLNLYAGIGGNRKLWPDLIEVTAVEWDPKIAGVYRDFFPQDTMIVTDAHQYLLEHYDEFDFIWSSPPCPSHSRLMNWQMAQECTPKFPDMKLYEEIIFLKSWFKGKFCVENVISYYEPLIKPHIMADHYFWSNFFIPEYINGVKRGIAHEPNNYEYRTNLTGFDLSKYTGIDKQQLLNNCVEPKLGLHVFNSAFKGKQEKLGGFE